MERPQETPNSPPETAELREITGELEQVAEDALEKVEDIEAEAEEAIENLDPDSPEQENIRGRIKRVAANFKEASGAYLRLVVLAGLVLVPSDERTGPPRHEDFNKKVERARIELETKGITSEQKQAYIPLVNLSINQAIFPVGYAGHLEPDVLLNHLIKGRETVSGTQGFKKEDAWRLYLGIPQQNKTFDISRYQPSKKSEDKYYYKINGFFRELLSNPSYSHSERLKMIAGGAEMSSQLSTHLHMKDFSTEVMGVYTIGHGRDENGFYISYYDVWDLDIPIERDGFFGKPFEIYDRLYYDPETFEPIFED